MKNQPSLQAVVVPLESQQPNAASIQIALFNEDGTPYVPSGGDSEGQPLPMATIDEPGLIRAADNVPNSEATTIEDLVSDYNELLDSLRAAGVLYQNQTAV